MQDELPFAYDEFKGWYAGISARHLEPARQSVVRILGELMEESLVEFDRVRIRLAASRVKSAPRVWAKLDQPKYRSKVAKLDDIPIVLDDLVGVRIVCNNISDIRVVQDLLSNLADSTDDQSEPLSIQSGSEKMYLDPPKETGYRAYHINLQTRVPGHNKWHDVTVELQVRTLLQDGWGELTHEDTYKTAFKLPPLAQTLAKRMANLLSCVDEIAQDIRDQLDELARNPEESRTEQERIFEARLAESQSVDSVLGRRAIDAVERVPEEALLQETRSLVSRVAKPTSLASIAHELQALFGQDIARTSWGRFGSFKGLLIDAVPDANIVNVGPGMLMPRGSDPALFTTQFGEVSLDGVDVDVPPLMAQLRRFDNHVPAVDAEALANLLHGVEIALNRDVWNSEPISPKNLGLRDVNLLSKSARDTLRTLGTEISRAKLGYMLTALLFSGNLRSELPRDLAFATILSYLKGRISKNSIAVDSGGLSELDEWFEHGIELRKSV